MHILRNVMISSLLASLLWLSACAGGSGPTSEQISELAAQIKAAAIQACSFQPDVASLSALVAAFYAPAEPFAVIVSSATKALCESPVTAAATRRGVMKLTHRVTAPNGKAVLVTGTTYGAGKLQYRR